MKCARVIPILFLKKNIHKRKKIDINVNLLPSNEINSRRDFYLHKIIFGNMIIGNPLLVQDPSSDIMHKCNISKPNPPILVPRIPEEAYFLHFIEQVTIRIVFITF